MGGVGRLACQGFLLGKLVSVFWCMEMDFFPLECNGVPSDEFCNGSVC